MTTRNNLVELVNFIIAQSTSSGLTKNTLTQASIKWLFFNVILALFPLLLNIILVKIGQVSTSRAELLKDGELFFFSTTIAASSVGSILFQNPPNPINVTNGLITYKAIIPTGWAIYEIFNDGKNILELSIEEVEDYLKYVENNIKTYP